MAEPRNRSVVLTTRAAGLPTPDLFEVVQRDIPEPGPNEVLVSNIYVSADPGMKGWISSARNYASVDTGATMRSAGVGEVVVSRHPEVTEGDLVVGNTGWQEFGITSPADPGFRTVDPADGPISLALSILGLTGLTAYFGLLEVGRPQAGETVLVSTAAGAVGSAVGQIAKIKGCRTVGIAGGPTKVALCRDEFGYDDAIDYKSVTDLDAALRAACPDGVDLYFDNVGGSTLDTVSGVLNLGGRAVICGTAATASWDPPPAGRRLERAILINRLRIQGFIVMDYQDRYAEALDDLRHWVQEGKIRHREDIADGLAEAPRVLAGLYQGTNVGRALIQVRPDPTQP